MKKKQILYAVFCLTLLVLLPIWAAPSAFEPEVINCVPLIRPEFAVSLPAAALNADDYPALQQRDIQLDLPVPAAPVRPESTPLLVAADAEGRILTTLKCGQICYVTEAYVNGCWHRVVCGKKQGYVDCGAVDVRGFKLDYIYDSRQSMLTTTGLTAEQLDFCLGRGLSGMGAVFARAEAEYGVNALFLIAICQEESASGTSALAVNRNNLAGIGGSGGWKSFDSYAACVDYLAELLSAYYLNADSRYFHGYTIGGVSNTYCGGSTHWVHNIGVYMEKDLAAIRQAEAVQQ